MPRPLSYTTIAFLDEEAFDEEPLNYTIESWWFLKWAHFSNNRWNEVFCTMYRNISTQKSSVFWALVERFGNLCQRVGCQRRLTGMKWHHLSGSRLEVSSVTSLQSELDWAWLRDITTWVSTVVETVGTLYFCLNIMFYMEPNTHVSVDSNN